MSNLTNNARPQLLNLNMYHNHSSKNRTFPHHYYQHLAQCSTKTVHGSKHRAMQINIQLDSSIVSIGTRRLPIICLILKIGVTQEEERTYSSNYSPMIPALHKLIYIKPFFDLLEIFSVIQHPGWLGIHTVEHIIYK